MKYIAYYLPQFHEVKENNEWWGDGFTEWTNVKNAKPFFEEHYQPKEPLDDYYYDLLDVQTLRHQANLANDYGIFGFCFYHYWFKNGRQLLEKPAELLLNNEDIPMNFCFSWANEPWTRSWDGKNGEIIMPQDYGNVQEWKEHFEYLLPFFKDKRYIKINDKPVFVIYKPDSFNRIEEMIDLWRRWSKEAGLPDIYIIRTLRSRDFAGNNFKYDAAVEFEPAYSNYNLSFATRLLRKIVSKTNNVRFKNKNKLVNPPYSYKKITEMSLNKKPLREIATIPGIFVNWDNTPRKGKNGIYFSNFSINLFENYVRQKSLIGLKEYKTNFLFINAWNEWAEGTYLEPDKKYGYAYLKVIKKIGDELNNGERL